MQRLTGLLVIATLFLSAQACLAGVVPDPDRDELCFLNFDPEFADSGVPILGSYAVDHGACQGMSGIMAAFREGARFAPEMPAPANADEVAAILGRIMRGHRHGWALEPSARVVVPGFAGLRELCESHRKLFLRESVIYNADIAVREIAPLLPEFEYRKRSLVWDAWGLRRLDRELGQVREGLARGRSPLLLYFSHVVMVFSIQDRRAANGELVARELGVIDPNQREPRVISVPYAGDLPTAGASPMLWDVTPDRLF